MDRYTPCGYVLSRWGGGRLAQRCLSASGATVRCPAPCAPPPSRVFPAVRDLCNKEACGRDTDSQYVELAVEIFSMLADATRVRLILALRDAELSVNQLAGIVGKSPAAVSRTWRKCVWREWFPAVRTEPQSSIDWRTNTPGNWSLMPFSKQNMPWAAHRCTITRKRRTTDETICKPPPC